MSLPKLTEEESMRLASQVRMRMTLRGMTHQMLSTRMTEDLGVEDVRVTMHDINSMVYRGQGLKFLPLIMYLIEVGLLVPEEDLCYAKDEYMER